MTAFKQYIKRLPAWKELPSILLRWVQRDSNIHLVGAFGFIALAVFSENGTTWTIFSIMHIFLWSLAGVIRVSIAQALGGLFASLGRELKKYPSEESDNTEHPKRDS